MALKTLDDLFVHMVRDIYHAEKQALRAMRQMSRKASSDELKQLLEEHREQTEGQIERLDKVFEQLGMRARGTTCEAINGIVEEAKEIMEDAEGGPTRDAGLIAAAQALEHYEISRYGTMISWAQSLGHKEVVDLLKQTLDEEKTADGRLTKLAETALNERAKGGESAEAGAGNGRRKSGGSSGSGRGQSGGRSLDDMSEEEIAELSEEEDMDAGESGGGRRQGRGGASSRAG